MIRLFAAAAGTALLLTCASATAQDADKNERKLARVSSLNTVKANQEFNRNVALMRAKRERAAELKANLDAEKNAAKKKEIQKQLDAAMKDLNENNQKMVKAYGFSLNRNYVMVVEKAHVYMQVSDKEAKAIEAKLKAKEGNK